MLSSPVSMTRSARSRSPLSRSRSSAIESTTPRAACGWRRRVPSNLPDQDVVGRVQKQDADPVASRLERVDRRQHVVEVSSAPPDHEGDPLHLRAGTVHQLGDLGDEGGRHVVDHEPAPGPRAWPPPSIGRPRTCRSPPGTRSPVHLSERVGRAARAQRRVQPLEDGGTDRGRQPGYAESTRPSRHFGGQARPPTAPIRRAAALGPESGDPVQGAGVIRLPRRVRWYEMAKRWASSRRRWSR